MNSNQETRRVHFVLFVFLNVFSVLHQRFFFNVKYIHAFHNFRQVHCCVVLNHPQLLETTDYFSFTLLFRTNFKVLCIKNILNCNSVSDQCCVDCLIIFFNLLTMDKTFLSLYFVPINYSKS